MPKDPLSLGFALFGKFLLGFICRNSEVFGQPFNIRFGNDNFRVRTTIGRTFITIITISHFFLSFLSYVPQGVRVVQVGLLFYV